MLRLSKASVGWEELNEIEMVFTKTVNFGLGVHVQQFEQQLQQSIGGGVEVICVNTGTAALHIALESLCFPKGSEVIIPSITFVASFSAVSAAGLIPVACDVTYPDCHLDCDDLKRRITKKTVAIMPVSYSGTDFDRVSVYAIAEQHGLRVIEDDAHSFGGTNSDGVKYGASGDVVCFSFDGIKNITCGEGGAIVTKDKDFAHQVRIRRSLGIEKDVELRYKGTRAWDYDVAVQGFRYHMSNINAAIGTAQLAKLSSFQSKKWELTQAYARAFEEYGLDKFLVPTQSGTPTDILHIMSCLMPRGFPRATLQKKLRENGFESGFHYVPNHTHSMYKTSYNLPMAEDVGARLISLPYHVDVPLEAPSAIAKVCRDAFS